MPKVRFTDAKRAQGIPIAPRGGFGRSPLSASILVLPPGPFHRELPDIVIDFLKTQEIGGIEGFAIATKCVNGWLKPPINPVDGKSRKIVFDVFRSRRIPRR